MTDSHNRPFNAKYTCYWCMKEFSSLDDLQKCSRCQLVRYCSTACQKASWRTHKQGCNTHLRDSLAKSGRRAEKYNSLLSKWIAVWRSCLMDWAIWSIGMEGKPRDWLQKHCLLIELEERENPPADIAQRFVLVGGDVVTRASIVQFLEDTDTDPEFVEDYKNDIREPFTIQIVINAPCNLMRMLWFSIRDWETRRQRRNEDLQDVVSRYWWDDLAYSVDKGDVFAPKKFLERMTMRIVLEKANNSKELYFDAEEVDEHIRQAHTSRTAEEAAANEELMAKAAARQAKEAQRRKAKKQRQKERRRVASAEVTSGEPAEGEDEAETVDSITAREVL